MTSSFRPGAANVQGAHSTAPSYSQPSGQTYSQSSSRPQYNTGAATSSTIKTWAQQQSYLDVYMVNAFYLGTAQRSQYFMSFWKTATCFGLQFIGILLLWQDQWEAYQEQSAGGCAGEIKGNVAIIGFFFATYITIFCTEQIRSLNRYGMYGWGEQQPDFVNSLWVGLGLWTNLFSLVLSWFVSCIIIFTSSNILDMVLNSVAVTFMLTLDDEIIGSSDYNRIANWDGGNNSACMAANTIFKKIGGLLLKIHPCWQRRIQARGCTIECCDLLLCPFMIVIPFIVLFCYPFCDNICIIEELCEEFTTTC